MTKVYDVVVLGLGAMGSAALYQLSVIKKVQPHLSILGLDQFQSPHSYGASHGETRVTREANYRGEPYVALAKRSNQLFKDIANKTQKQFGELYTPTGGLILDSSASYEYIARIQESAVKQQINHHLMLNKQLQQQYPQFKLTSRVSGYFENNMGYLEPENCITAQLYLAKQNGAEINSSVKIIAYEKIEDEQIKLIDEQGHFYLTKKLIICAGSWVNKLLPTSYQHKFKVYRQVIYWFAVKPELETYFYPNQFPVFVWYLNQDDVVYGFPIIGKTASIKIAAENGTDYSQPYNPIYPETVNRQVSEAEQRNMYTKFIQPYFHGVTEQCINAKVCLYTVAPNWNFVIDYLPGYNQKIIVASPCSGHGFKHSAAIGEALAEQAVFGKSTISVMKEFSCF